MGTGQSENKDREGKRRVIIATAGRPAREVWLDKTFEKTPYVKRLKPHRQEEKRTVVFENAPVTRADLYWLAYQRGYRDGRRKESES